MIDITKQKLIDHEKYLKKDLFFTKKKWPQFNLLFDDVKKLSRKISNNSKIVFLERNLLYGGSSLFAPFFYKNDVISIDCSTKRIKQRGSYNLRFLKNPKILKFGTKKTDNYKKISLKNNTADLIIVPNLMHHISDFNKFLSECYRILKKDGKLYVFEPTFREQHQDPEDFFRFTPNSFREILKNNKFKVLKVNRTGGAFSAAIYCLDQASQYLPGNIKKKYKKKINDKLIKDFLDYEKKYKKNLVRKHTSFPTAFSIIGKK